MKSPNMLLIAWRNSVPRFSTTTLLAAMTIACVMLAIERRELINEKAAATGIERIGGRISWRSTQGQFCHISCFFMRQLDLECEAHGTHVVYADLAGGIVEPSILKSLSNLPALTSLCVDGTGFSDPDIEYISDLTSLQALSVCDTDVTDLGVLQLSRLRSLRCVLAIGTDVSPSCAKVLYDKYSMKVTLGP